MKAKPLSTGNSPDHINQLLANLERLVSNPPKQAAAAKPKQPAKPLPIKWWAVKYDTELGLLDATTLRQEPSQQANPNFIEQPLLFPWVYVSATPHLPDISEELQLALPPLPANAVHWINCRLTFRVVSLLDVKALADIVTATGGQLFTHLQRSRPEPEPPQIDPLRSASREKHLTIARHRSQPLRYTRQLRNGQRLADVVNSRPVSSGNRTRYTAPSPPVPAPQLQTFGHQRLATEFQITGQEAEDELRNWLGIHTFAEEIVQALELKG